MDKITILCWAFMPLILGSFSVADFLDEKLDPSVYDSRVRPGVDSGQPVIVFLDMYIVSISSIDEVKMEYALSIFMRQRWIDDRLTFDEELYPEDVTLNYNMFDRLWVPDLFVKNEKKATFHEITVPNRLLKVASNGQVYYSQRLTLTLGCDMNLAYYPMDNQTCTIELESYGYTTRDIVFRWKEDGNPVQTPDKLTMPEFLLTNKSTGDCTVEYITGTFSCLVAKLHMKRQFEYYLIQTFVPSCLIVSLSWVSFWIDIYAVPARVTLGLLTVLTMTTQSSGISSRLPRVSYIKAIDVWMTCCLVFVFGALIEYSIVNVLARKEDVVIEEKEKKEEEVDEELVEKGSVVKEWAMKTTGDIERAPDDNAVVGSGSEGHYDIDTSSVSVQISAGSTTNSRPTTPNGYPSNRIQDQSGSQDLNKLYGIDSNKKKKSKPNKCTSCFSRMRRNPALALDIVSRGLFPGIFIVFNIIYWIRYKNGGSTAV